MTSVKDSMPVAVKVRGFTLVSLLISMVIGLFLVGAVFKIYLDSKSSFDMRQVVAGVSENQRYVIDEMRRILLMVGRDIRAMEDQEAGHEPFPALGAGGNEDGGSTGSDVVAIRYRTGPSCGGYQNVPQDTAPTKVRFYIDNIVGGSGVLKCEVTEAGGDTTSYSLVGGVHRLKVLYGVDDDGDGYANRYLSASRVNDPDVVPVPAGASSGWIRVVSLKLGLVLRSESEIPLRYRPGQPDTMKLFGLTVNAPDNRHLYRVTTTALALRNFNPVMQRQ